MTKEIKEILDKLKDNDWYEELDLTGTKWIELKQEETNQLLDYITNLQEKVNEYENPDDMTLMFMWCDEKAKDKIKQLQEEKKRLQDRNIELVKEDYKSRNKKAIEFIKEHSNNFVECLYVEEVEELLNILN